ncbi:MAG: O-antigen ligase family protein [Pseudomonadota bacterium]
MILTSARWLSVLMVLSLFFSTALISISESLLLVLFLILLVKNKTLEQIKSSIYPLAVKVGLVLLALIFIQTLTSPEKFSIAISHFTKYRELLLLPVLVFVLNNSQWKKIIYYSFLAGIVMMLMHSYMQYFILADASSDDIEKYTSFVGRIAGAIMLAFACYAFLEEALKNKTTINFWLWLGLFILSSFALLFFYNGRTGILIYLILFIIWGFRFLGVKGSLITSFIMLILLVIIFQSSEEVRERTKQTQRQLSSLFNSEHPEDVKEIKGVVKEGVLSREVMYLRVFAMIKQRSIIENIFGSGTGSLNYHSQKKQYEVENPHNEYLLIFYENGIAGLMLLLGFFFFAWYQSNQLDEHEKWLLRALVITFTIGSLVNSLLLDNKEAHFYILLLAALIPVTNTSNKSVANKAV